MSSQKQNDAQLLEWLEKEKLKDSAELLADRKNFIKQIREFRKSDIKNSDEIKLTLWQKIKKTLGL